MKRNLAVLVIVLLSAAPFAVGNDVLIQETSVGFLSPASVLDNLYNAQAGFTSNVIAEGRRSRSFGRASWGRPRGKAASMCLMSSVAPYFEIIPRMPVL